MLSFLKHLSIFPKVPIAIGLTFGKVILPTIHFILKDYVIFTVDEEKGNIMKNTQQKVIV